jgi:hypothetical protein
MELPFHEVAQNHSRNCAKYWRRWRRTERDLLEKA